MKILSICFFSLVIFFFSCDLDSAEEPLNLEAIYKKSENLRIYVIPEKKSVFANESVKLKIILFNFSKNDKSVIVSSWEKGFGSNLNGIIFEQIPNKNNQVKISSVSQTQGGTRMKKITIKSGEFKIIESYITPFIEFKGSGYGLFSLDVDGNITSEFAIELLLRPD